MELTFDPNIKNDLNHYKGKPFIMRVHFDGENESEMQFNADWTFPDIVDSIKKSMIFHHLIYGQLKRVHIVDVWENIAQQN